MPDPKPVTLAHRIDARERLAVACKGIDEWTATGTWPAQEWHDRDSFSAHRSTLSILAQAIADAEERSEAKLHTLRAESLRIAAELLRLSGTDVFGVEMLLRTHVVELAMKLKEAYLVAGEQP